MKSLSVLLCAVLLSACAGFEISNTDSTHQFLAYAAGRGMGTYINEAKPEVDSDLTNAWVGLMERNEGQDIVGSTEMVGFYNECLGIVTGQDYDKYGLMGDLAMLLKIYGAELEPTTKTMTTIQPVPYAILETFATGYSYGRAMVRK